MAFMRYANAAVVCPDVGKTEWGMIRKASRATVAKQDLQENLVTRAASLFGKPFNPNDYLLTHCTIVASVDTMESGLPTGSFLMDGFKGNRKFSDFRVKPECDKFLNNNLDGWSRGVLLKAYPTFIGGHNFCFVPGTEVLLADGSPKPIEELKVGDQVLTHTGNVHSITQVFERDYSGDIQIIHVDRYKKPIVATSDHPFRGIQVEAPELYCYEKGTVENVIRYRQDQIVKALRGEPNSFGTDRPAVRKLVALLADGPKSCAELIAGGVPSAQLRLRKNPTFFEAKPIGANERPDLKGRTRPDQLWYLRKDAPKLTSGEVTSDIAWIPAKDLEYGSYLLGPECTVGTAGDEDKAVMLGYYLSEGCRMSPHKHEGVVLSFGPHEGHLAADADIRARRIWPDASVIIRPAQSTLRVEIRSEEADLWLRGHGGDLAHAKQLSEDVFSWNRECLLKMLASWMTGDGTLNGGTLRLVGATASRKFAYQMQRVADLCGIKTSVVFSKQKIGETVSVINMMIGGVLTPCPVIPRHHSWNVIVSRGSGTDLVSRSLRWTSEVAVTGKRDDFAWWKGHRVHKVQSNTRLSYSGKVYNIAVDTDNSYVIVPGIAVHNCEHVQIEELSKGRIIDAVARDIGDSLYVDILIATQRKHTDLIKAIENHKMSTLSMGCTTDGTCCTKCGHWAADETELCQHIKYEKGNSFYDEKGNRHRVAELCGHESMAPHGGVHFIEASWVGVPAFTGAVLRNVLVPGADLAKKAQEILASPPPQWSSDSRILSASKGTIEIPRFMPPKPGIRIGGLGDPRLSLAADDDVFLAGWAEDAPADDAEAPGLDAPPSEGDAPASKAPAPEDPFKGLEDEMVKTVKDRVQKRLKEELNPAKPGLTPEQSAMSSNSNVVKDAKARYVSGLDAIVRTASSDVDLMNAVASFNDYNGIKIPVSMYRTALKVGSSVQYASVSDFWDACRVALKREPTVLEAKTLLRLGKLLARGQGSAGGL